LFILRSFLLFLLGLQGNPTTRRTTSGVERFRNARATGMNTPSYNLEGLLRVFEFQSY